MVYKNNWCHASGEGEKIEKIWGIKIQHTEGSGEWNRERDQGYKIPKNKETRQIHLLTKFQELMNSHQMIDNK